MLPCRLVDSPWAVVVMARAHLAWKQGDHGQALSIVYRLGVLIRGLHSGAVTQVPRVVLF